MYRTTFDFDKSEKDSVFNLEFSGSEYEFEISYNKVNDSFYITIRDVNGEDIVTCEKIVYGEKIFADINFGDLPEDDFVPLDESGKCHSVTFETMNDGVYITVDDLFTGELDENDTQSGELNPDGNQSEMIADDNDGDDSDEDY